MAPWLHRGRILATCPRSTFSSAEMQWRLSTAPSTEIAVSVPRARQSVLVARPRMQRPSGLKYALSFYIILFNESNLLCACSQALHCVKSVCLTVFLKTRCRAILKQKEKYTSNYYYSYPRNPVYARRLDPSVLAFSLSLYQNPSICILFSSRYTSYNKQNF